MELVVHTTDGNTHYLRGIMAVTIQDSERVEIVGFYPNDTGYTNVFYWDELASPDEIRRQVEPDHNNNIYVAETGFPGGRTYEGVTSCTVVEGKYISLMANVDSNFSYGVRLEWDTMKDPQSVINQLKTKGIKGGNNITSYDSREPDAASVGDVWFTGHSVWRKEA